ncbi:MAG: arsenosugar biosynthesis radical SAM protein ArsS [Myxococcales bacterium]|jgi:radical SAM/Cys-rich protein
MRLNVVPDSSRVAGPDFGSVLGQHGVATPRRARLTTLQINVGKRCNQACQHCHVEAGPARTEMMDGRTARRLIELAASAAAIDTVDITGGAPELNPHFRELVTAMRALGKRVIDRCNLTILLEPGQEDLAGFLAAEGVDIVASLPCYGRDNVDKQRGKGVFERSIEALHRLNRLGYGVAGSGLSLDLVYNPLGAFLPPAQDSLEAQYKRELRALGGIEFNRLLTLTNMPIKRFAHALDREGQYDDYMRLLQEHFNPGTVEGLMCRSQVSVGYDGALYDCDFNQMLELPLDGRDGTAETIWSIDALSQLDGSGIATDSHCLGCTAGAGSSCGGAID